MTDTSPKPFVFVLMPFHKEFDDVYKLGIKPACEKAGAYAERVDEQIYEGSILQRIYNQIAKADIIISDMTGRNPNVFYETGYAHALGKRVILLTQRTEDIPFDLKHYPHIIYEGSIFNLIPEIEKRVSFLIRNPEKASLQVEEQLQFFVMGLPLEDDPVIELVKDRGPYFFLRIAAYNCADRVIKKANFQVAFLTSRRIQGSSYTGSGVNSLNTAVNPLGKIIHIYNRIFSLLPGGWESIPIFFTSVFPTDKEPEEVILQVISENGPKNYPFRVNFRDIQKSEG